MTTGNHARAKALFLEAIDQPPSERAAFVAAVAGDDPALRREVESLLAFHRDDTLGPAAAAPSTTARLLWPGGRSSSGRLRSLPHHLLTRATKRLEVASLVILACVVVMWGVVNAVQGELADEFVFARQWVPPVALIVASLGMVAACRSGLDPRRLIRLGLVYEVVVSVALVVAQYADAFRVPAAFLDGDRVGLSYVATWTLFFTVMVPAPPAEALVALVASNAAVPLMYWQQMLTGRAPHLPPVTFISIFVGPYVLGVIGSYVAARIVHQLGVEVGRAHELGSYRLEARLGRGGMGEVWRASHHTLARPAAVKVIRPDVVGRDPDRAAAALARFEAEAQIIASLESPHTIRLYDFGTADDGNLYYVMELLDGVDLDALVRRGGPLPPARVVHLLRQVCASLAEAHHRGLVHRDIKPANIYVCRQGLEYDVVKVLDFGLATMFSGRSPDDAGDGAVLGTPDYMAPETTEPGGTVDGQADVYAVGALGFWLLTGRVVFPRESVAQVMHAHRRDAPLSPDALVTDLPPELDRLIMACLAKSPAARPPGALAVAGELAAIARTLPWSPADAAAAWRG